VQVATGLLLIYTIGAIIGPTSAAALMTYLPAGAIFAFTALVHTGMTVLTVIRLKRRRAVPVDQRDPFTAMPRTSPAAVELSPHIDTADSDAAVTGEDQRAAAV
jgi:hypothetical protein